MVAGTKSEAVVGQGVDSREIAPRSTCPLLGSGIPALGVSGAVASKALLDLEEADIYAADRAGDDGSAPGLGAVWRAGYDLPAYEFLEIFSCVGATALTLAPIVFRGSNTLKSHVDTLDDDIVAVLCGRHTLYEDYRSVYSGDDC